MRTRPPSPSEGAGGEAAYCAACDLPHARRPDWLCPRCGMPVEYDAARARRRVRAAAEARDEEFPAGSFVAGAVLAVTGLVLATSFARRPVVEHRWPLVAAMALLLVLGIELLIKVAPARWVAIALAAAAAIRGGEDVLRARVPDLPRDPLPAALRAPLHDAVGARSAARLLAAAGLLAGALLLLVGRPGRARIAAGVLLAAPLAVAEIVSAVLS